MLTELESMTECEFRARYVRTDCPSGGSGRLGRPLVIPTQILVAESCA